MSGDNNAQEKNFRNGLIAALSTRGQIPTVDEVEALARQMAPFFNYSGDLQDVVNEALTSIVTRMSSGVSLIDPNTKHDDQWVRKRGDINWVYSNAYEEHLQRDGWADPMVQSLSDVTGKILGLLQNPQEEGSWDRRGLVIGHVQSGKTANYTGLIAKAADAGYRFIIVIAGIHNNLRRQTQERIDEAFIGRSSDPDDRKNIGVGLNKDYPHPATLTTTVGDFNKQTASHGWKLADVNKPVILIIKKNVSTLTALYKWLSELNAEGGGQILDIPMLIIDDEADNASVNTNKEDVKPTRTNTEIRNILSLFAKRCYVGYTATPFANIFIDPDAYDKKVQEELFPKDFIYCLDAPSTYFGAEKVFLNEQTSESIVKTITDCEDLIPLSHKREDPVTELPPSLYRALDLFIVARAIRNLRGQRKKHCSMMVNVSRFVPVQKAVRDLLSLRERKIREAVKANYRMPESTSSANVYMQALRTAFDKEYASSSGVTWEQVKGELNGVFENLHLYVINSKSEDDLDFGKYAKEGIGLTAIAVGGLSLSRGLTIEGLTISYMYRNTKMYDTLMQMGRWFGYRPNFEDLCRVYLSQDSINWYAHIAHSSGELIEQVYRMRQLKKSPRDFGLYVKKHPDSLLITARNKMRTGTEVVLEQTLAGCLREAYRVAIDEKVNERNFELIEEYWRRGFDGSLEETKKGWIARNVPLKTIEEFVLRFGVHDHMLQDKEFIVEYLHAIPKLYPVGDVLLISPRAGEGGDQPYRLNHQLRVQGNGEPENGGWHLNKNRVASRGDESLGLSNEQIKDAETAARQQAAEAGGSGEPSDTHYRAQRNKPLLMIHSLKARLPKDASDSTPLLPHPVATFGVSFPYDGSGTTITVVANKVWIEQNRRAFIEVDEEEGDGDE